MKTNNSKLKPSSYLLLSELNRLEAALSDLDPEEAEKRIEAANEKFDKLALVDPIEATKIFLKSNYFDEDILENEICLSTCIFVNKSELSALNTPEKRREYLAGIESGEAKEPRNWHFAENSIEPEAL